MNPSAILLIEDDSFKLKRVLACLGKRSDSVTIATSVQAAVVEVNSRSFDVILVDMALPSHDLRPGGGPGTSLLSGGIEVIMELAYLGRSDPVVIITQYPEIEVEGELLPVAKVQPALQKLFDVRIKAVILYKHLSDEWEIALLEAVG